MYSLDDFDDYKESDKHGLYALYLKKGCSLSPFFKEEWCKKIYAQMKKYNCPNLLYIGKAESETLYKRIKEQHLTFCIRWSTSRYTMSYFAGMQLYGCEGCKIHDERLIKIEDEDEITKWLLNNTDFKIIETENCKTLEKVYIKKYCPSLNIKDNPNPILGWAERSKKYKILNKECFLEEKNKIKEQETKFKNMSLSDIVEFYNKI